MDSKQTAHQQSKGPRTKYAMLARAGERLTARVLSWIVFAVVVGFCHSGRAQWITQTNALRSGWNAVFLHVDASHVTLSQLVASDASNPIQEIWYWRSSLPTGQFIDSPQLPAGAGSQWSTWMRPLGTTNALQRLTGNGAYLVRLATNAAAYNWLVKGKPVAPTYRWTLTGLNFIGFPLVTGESMPWRSAGAKDRRHTPSNEGQGHCSLMFAALMIGHHLSTSALCQTAKASGVS